MSATNDNRSDDYVVDITPISLLQKIQENGRYWEELSTEYGVTNPDPPWKITLETTCDLLAADSCVKPYDEVDLDSCALPSLERRTEEDELSETIYEDVPFPERQLLALAHSMIKRGLLNENELAERMEELEKRFNSA
ncbi:hypothetical protein [Thiohalophilus sp.]|uniref:hypothetical protein n=1 Tax=Thiohalophilus sp. TaxID=3028392 RepID=UPI002ACEFDFC|nr:hypothetical protein [Thiohalophilus sp.]MDZ7803957.1 hypothetical protein [Thiohalophilus sp.]